jgi:hypothetical protein
VATGPVNPVANPVDPEPGRVISAIVGLVLPAALSALVVAIAGMEGESDEQEE